MIDSAAVRNNPAPPTATRPAHGAAQALARPDRLAAHAQHAPRSDDHAPHGPLPDAQFIAGQDALRAYGHEAQQAGVLTFASQRSQPVTAKAGAVDAAGVIVGNTVYEVRPYTRPTIHHDNGFLQNPNDPSDPMPMPTRAPTQTEREYYRSEVVKATGGTVASRMPFSDRIDARLGLDNALPAYKHFLTGNGADRTFDYAAYLRDDPAGRQTAAAAVADIRTAADQLYPTLDRQVGKRPGDSLRFEVQGDPNSASYPKTEDWQKAIGGHTQWSSASVVVTRQKDGSLMAQADVTLRAEDRYNFNPGQKDIKTGVPDAQRGVLEQAGLAHQFTQRGQAAYSTSWTIGAPGAAGPLREGHSR